MKLWRAWFLLLGVAALSGSPVSFGRAELDAALAARGLHLRIQAEIGDLPADGFKIEATRVRGGDLRGLMYGLLEAADQVRASGRLRPLSAAPLTASRGARMAAGDDPLAGGVEYWQGLFQTLARGRFNRFHLVFERAPETRVLVPITQAAADYGLDFVLGLNEASYDGVKALLAACPSIRAVEVAAPSDDAARATAEAGRRVLLEVRGTAGLAPELEITRDYDKAALLKWGRESYGETK